MEIKLYSTISESNKINKDLKLIESLTGSLRDELSVINPELLINVSNFPTANYCFIKDFNRYYFINEVKSVKNGLWRIKCQVDVLTSYSSFLKTLPVIISDTELTGADNYLPSEVWKTKVKDTTEIKTFPNGLNENGEFILITAGG